MFARVAEFIGNKPYIMIVVTLLITLAFSSLLPSMKSGTSLEDFTPKDNEMVKAEERIRDYFGGSTEVEMVLVESKKDILSADCLKELYRVVQYINDTKGVDSTFGVSNLVDVVSFMEYHKSLLDCSDDEVETVIRDIFYSKDSIRLCADGEDQEKGYADIKEVWLESNENYLTIFIKVKDLSEIENRHLRPIEWDICFFNALAPCEELKMNYMVGARYEPSVKWCVGKGFFNNVRGLLEKAECEKNLYLWIKPKDSRFYFPINLERSSFSFDFSRDTIIVSLDKEELGEFGIAPKFNGKQLPAKLVNVSVKSRIYRFPWFGFGIKGDDLRKYIEWMEKMKFVTRIAKKRGIDFERIDAILSRVDGNSTFSLKDLDRNWVTLDSSTSTEYIFIKPPFMDDIAESINSLLSKDKKKTLIIVQENKTLDLDKAKELGKELCKKIRNINSDFRLEVTGGNVISYQIDVLTSKSNRYITPGIFVAIILILLVNFRRVSFIFLPLLCLSISIIWLFGTMVLFGMKFNAMNVALIPLIMGLGVDYSVHLFYNYRTELSKGANPLEAIKTSIRNVGTAMFLATVTTSISFLSFLNSSIPPMRSFGILCAFGIFYAFIVTLTFEAAVVYLIDRKKKKIVLPRERKIGLGNTMRFISTFVTERWKIVIAFMILLTFIFSCSATKVDYSFSMEEFLPGNTPAMRTLEKVSDMFPSASRMEEYILIEGDISSTSVLEGIYETLQKMEDDETIARHPDGSLKVESILSVIEEIARNNESVIEKFNLDDRYIPRTDKDLEILLDYIYEKYPYVKNLLHRDGYFDATLIRIHLINEKLSSEFAENVHREIIGDLSNYGDAKAIVTGPVSLMYTITKSLTESQLKSTFVCLLVAGLVLITVYRRISLGSITMVPVILSSVWIIGSMYLLGYTLNVMTVMVTSLTIGLGITYAIHAVERFKLISIHNKDAKSAVVETFSHVGGAIFISALTTIAGFSILILSPMPPEQQFGIITALTIFYALVTTLLILPPLLMMWKKRIENRGREDGKEGD